MLPDHSLKISPQKNCKGSPLSFQNSLGNTLKLSRISYSWALLRSEPLSSAADESALSKPRHNSLCCASARRLLYKSSKLDKREHAFSQVVHFCPRNQHPLIYVERVSSNWSGWQFVIDADADTRTAFRSGGGRRYDGLVMAETVKCPSCGAETEPDARK